MSEEKEQLVSIFNEFKNLIDTNKSFLEFLIENEYLQQIIEDSETYAYIMVEFKSQEKTNGN